MKYDPDAFSPLFPLFSPVHPCAFERVSREGVQEEGTERFAAVIAARFFRFHRWVRWFLVLTLASPSIASERLHLRVAYNPYGGVNWSTTQRCLSQHHDHVGVNESRIRAYDEAGYHALVLLHYSGVKSLSYAWHERHWPLSDYLSRFSTDEDFLATCSNLALLFPGAEEVGGQHMTSPFIESYIELWEPNLCPIRQPYHYATNQECIDRVTQYGGLAVLAHPWHSSVDYGSLRGYAGMEIYTAYAQYHHCCEGWPDLNAALLDRWDQLLSETSTKLWGFAVNDWFGPAWSGAADYPEVADSGKTLVLVSDITAGSYRAAVESGAFFALRDLGATKMLVPEVDAIIADAESITVQSSGDVTWWSGGEVVFVGPTLLLGELACDLQYVRAEATNAFGTVYIQPFTLGSPFDADADGDVDLSDFAGFLGCFGTSGDDECNSTFDGAGSPGVDVDDYVGLKDAITGPG